MSILISRIKNCFSSNKLDFLKDLGLKSENLGAYFNGKWQGSG